MPCCILTAKGGEWPQFLSSFHKTTLEARTHSLLMLCLDETFLGDTLAECCFYASETPGSWNSQPGRLAQRLTEPLATPKRVFLFFFSNELTNTLHFFFIIISISRRGLESLDSTLVETLEDDAMMSYCAAPSLLLPSSTSSSSKGNRLPANMLRNMVSIPGLSFACTPACPVPSRMRL